MNAQGFPRRARAIFAALFVCCSVAAMVGCQQAPQEETVSAPQAPQEFVPVGEDEGAAKDVVSGVPGFDLGQVMAQVRAAYRPSADASAWVGGDATYSVTVSAAGEVAFEAAHVDERAQVLKSGPLTLQTKAHTTHTGPTAVEVAADGHLMLRWSDMMTEHWRNTAQGAEQSWTFEHAPAPGEDIVIEVEAEGLEFAALTETGLHFVDTSTGVGVRYGHGTWIDAQGRTHHVPSAYEGGRIRLTVPADVVAASAFPAVLDPYVSPEFGMDTAAQGPIAQNQDAPAVGWNNTNYLVVWQDYRAGAADVYGARVSPAGVVLDPFGIAISEATGDQTKPRVSSNGVNFMVVWQDSRAGATNANIYGAVVASTGSVTGTAGGFSISAQAGNETSPDIAWSGSNYLVVWSDNRSTDANIYGARVGSDGTVSDANGVAIETVAGGQTSPRVAWNNTQLNYLVVWETTVGSDIAARRLNASLAVQGATFSINTGVQGAPAVTSGSGSDFMVVWRSGVDIFGSRVGASSAFTTPAGVAIANPAAGSLTNPSVAWNGTNYVVTWQDDRNAIASGFDIYGARLSSTGALLDTLDGVALVTARGSQLNPSVVAGGANLLVTWQDERNFNTGHDIYHARLSVSGGALSVTDAGGLPTAKAANPQSTPAVAFNGTNYLVVWSDNRGVNGEEDIYGVRVSVAGAVLDPSGIAISTAAKAQIKPSVAAQGADFAVAWEDYRDTPAQPVKIFGARVSGAGAVLDASGTLLANDPTYAVRAPSLCASSGTQYALAYERETAATSAGIRVKSVFGGAGTVNNVYDANNSREPTIAFNGTYHLVLWTNTSGTGEQEIGKAVLNTAATGFQTPSALIAKAGAQSQPHAASNGSQFIAAWTERLNSQNDIYIQRTNADLGVVASDSPSGLRIQNTLTRDEVAPQVTWIGDRYLILFEATNLTPGLHVASINDTANVLMEIPSAAATGAQLCTAPALPQKSPNRTSLAACVFDDPSPTVANLRVVGRRISNNTLPLAPNNSLGTPEDTPLAITINATDADADPLTFRIVTAPTRGVLSGTGPNFTYTPFPDLNGADTFTYVVNDGFGDSNPGTINVNTSIVNDPPIFTPGSPVTTDEDAGPQTIAWASGLAPGPATATDEAAQTVFFSTLVVSTTGNLAFSAQPALSAAGQLTFTSAPNSFGTATVRATLRDSAGGEAAPADFVITVNPVNDPPTAADDAYSVQEDAVLTVPAPGVLTNDADIDGDALTTAVVNPPSNGTLSLSPGGGFSYTPTPDFSGSDSFTYTASDPSGASATATVLLSIVNANDCGDGTVVDPEACDDANTTPGDGCSALCALEPGWTCASPGVACVQTCGDGTLDPNEDCDDANTDPDDGCSAVCEEEEGWVCNPAGGPDACASVCGDGLVRGDEACDDNNNTPADGCFSDCTLEPNTTCSGEPSQCVSLDFCGDGALIPGEGCDDGARIAGDGCSDTCTVEDGFACEGTPSVCSADSDNDGIPNASDNCPDTANDQQTNSDSDANGDACDDDDDNDSIPDAEDACPTTAGTGDGCQGGGDDTSGSSDTSGSTSGGTSGDTTAQGDGTSGGTSGADGTSGTSGGTSGAGDALDGDASAFTEDDSCGCDSVRSGSSSPTRSGALLTLSLMACAALLIATRRRV